MVQYESAIDSSCSPPPAHRPWQASYQLKAEEGVGRDYIVHSHIVTRC